jgi:hypothetical protein
MGNSASYDADDEASRLDKTLTELHQQVFFARLHPFVKTIEGIHHTSDHISLYLDNIYK